MDTHFTLGWSWQSFTGEDLQEFYEVFTITHVNIKIIYATIYANKMRVDPFRECFLLYSFTFLCRKEEVRKIANKKSLCDLESERKGKDVK
jgi:hypothetical protein